jgi:lysophospholipase L1-like esterase
MNWLLIALLALLTCLSCSASPALLSRDDIVLRDMKITVPSANQTVAIDPLPVLHYELDGELALGEPGWRGDLLLPKTAWVYRALRPGSLVVTVAGKPEIRLAEGTDYLIDTDWGSLNAAPGSAIPPGTKLHFAYDYTRSRIDLVERTAGGALVVKKGVEDMDEPLLPERTPGNTPVFSVYLPHNTRKLTSDHINFVDGGHDAAPPVNGVEHIARARARLAAGEPVTIVFFGDSITDQGPEDFRDGEGSYVDRFVMYLRRRFPRREVVVTPKETVVSPKTGRIVVVKAGVGGNDTRDGLVRIESDVLAHKPDLVVVMFGVNDENRKSEGSERLDENNVPPGEYERNLAAMVTQIRDVGGETILMTTSMKNAGWIGTIGNLDQYAAAARKVARDEKACLVDNFQAWQDLPKRGYNYMVFLGSCINHPVDLGHQLFFEGLSAAFEQ